MFCDGIIWVESFADNQRMNDEIIDELVLSEW